MDSPHDEQSNESKPANRWRWFRHLALRLILYAVLAWGISCIYLYFYQDNLLFYPSRNYDDHPAMPFEEVTLTSPDGVRLAAWFFPLAQPRYTVLFSHGNAGNMSHRMNTVEFWLELNCQIMMYDYRGFGHSEGKPSETGLYADAEAAWNWLVEVKHIEPAAIVIHGRSLGAAVALHRAVSLSAEDAAAAVILESAFLSVPTLASEFYPFFPVRLLSRYAFDNEQRIASVAIPKLIIHGARDELIPFRHGVTLYETAQAPRQFLRIEGDHNTGFLADQDTYRRGIKAFLTQVERFGS